MPTSLNKQIILIIWQSSNLKAPYEELIIAPQWDDKSFAKLFRQVYSIKQSYNAHHKNKFVYSYKQEYILS